MSHQDRRKPLPAEYQFPTHGVDCDCPPCRERTVSRPPDVAGQYMAGWELAFRAWKRGDETGYGFGV